jgi:hypothetical protein
MNHLAQLQHNFLHSILDRNQSSIVSAISASGRAAPTTQLAVYSNAYLLRLREVLEIDFPVLATVLGENAFNKLADTYIKVHPSHTYSLRSFGAQLATFLRKQPGYKETPVLAELATFEWGLGQAFDAVNNPVITTETMSQIPPENWPRLQLVFHASVYRIDFVWNTPELWKAHKADLTPPEIRKNSAPVPWIIWRQDYNIRFRSLEDNEEPFFNAAHEGASFANMCDVMSELIIPEKVPLHAASILKRWIRDGLISRIMYRQR